MRRNAEALQNATGRNVALVYVHQGYTGEQPQDDAGNGAEDYAIMPHVVRLSEAKRGFVLLPRRWVVEGSFSKITRFRRLAEAFKRLANAVAGLPLEVFACNMLPQSCAMSAQHARKVDLAAGKRAIPRDNPRSGPTENPCPRPPTADRESSRHRQIRDSPPTHLTAPRKSLPFSPSRLVSSVGRAADS